MTTTRYRTTACLSCLRAAGASPKKTPKALPVQPKRLDALEEVIEAAEQLPPHGIV